MKRTATVIAAIAACLSLSACSSSTDATKALQGAGYTEIQTDGYAFFGCSKDDTFHTKFTAKGPSGVRVSGVVCGGFLKGSTIRTD